MLYGKANDAKHYQKVAEAIQQMNHRYKATVGTRNIETRDAGETQVLEIRVGVSPAELAFRFWVNPYDDCWVYRQATMDSEGRWNDVWKEIVDWVGETDWDPPSFGLEKKPFTHRNFAKTTAHFFFAHGPLSAS